MNIRLDGKAALVTGAARGIGEAIASKLAASGASVLLADVDADALQTACTRITGKGGRAEIAAADLTRPETPDLIVQRAIDAFGALDIVVNNAGYTWDSVIQKTTDEQFYSMLDIHIVVPFRILRAASDYFRSAAKREKEKGEVAVRKVVNITSISGTHGNPGQSGYSSGKAAVIGLTKTLAKEWGRYNVTVNAVGFGFIDTRLIQPLGSPGTDVHIGERQIWVGMQPDVRETVTAGIPLRRIGTVEDAGNAVFFFCSPLSDYVTGEVLMCSGGVHF